MKPPKETNKVLGTDTKKMEIYELSDKEFKVLGWRNGSVG